MVITGLDIFLAEAEKYRGRNIALIANHTSLTRNLAYSWHEFKRKGLQLKKIYSPEHGLFATEEDQVSVSNQPVIGCDVVSLYGDSFGSLFPEKHSLQDIDEDIDLVVFDIQDIGARYYTYVNTMALFMKALAGTGIEMMILDRPNPLGGNLVEGPMLRDDFHSFVGVLPVTVRHGMTAGELALLYRDHEKLDVKLTVTAMKGWNRNMLYSDTGLPWTPPSPNMPTEETALIYPGMCLIEGLNVSEGRGTTVPFKVLGAPFINPDELSDYLNSLNAGGVFFRPVWFQPNFHKFANRIIGGVFIHVTDISALSPFKLGTVVTKGLCDLYGDSVSFIKGYEFNDRHPAFDILCGNNIIREMILSGASPDTISASYEDDEKKFIGIKRGYHLYES